MLGIAINDTELSIVELSYKKDRFHLMGYAIAPFDEGEVIDNQIIDSEQMGQNIAALKTQLKSKTKQAALALAANLVITREIELPSNYSEQDIEAQIRVDADLYIPYPLSEVSLDFEILGQSDSDASLSRILLVIARTEHIEQYSDALIFSGLQPKVIDIVPEVLQRAFQWMIQDNSDYPEVVALVDIGYTTTTTYIAHKGKFIFNLQQLFGEAQLFEANKSDYDLSEAESNPIHRAAELSDSSTAKLLQPFVEKLGQFLNIVFKAFEASIASKVSGDIISVSHIILSGNIAGLSQLDSSLQNTMSLPVTLANPFTSMTFDRSIDTKQLLEDAPQLMTACGLGMRSHPSLQEYS